MAQVRRRTHRGARNGFVIAAGVVACLLAVAMVIFLLAGGDGPGLVVERTSQTAAQDDAASTSEAAPPQTTREAVQAILVHVDGAVACPGVIELKLIDPRVRDAVDAAGGLVEGADTGSINLAASIEDAQKIHVPYEGESSEGSETEASAGGAAAAAGPGTGLVNINTASEAELDGLPGVGPSTAAAIVEDRQSNGAFSTPEDLMRVSGIGEKKFAKLKDHICV